MMEGRWRLGQWWLPAMVLTSSVIIGIAPLVPPRADESAAAEFSVTRAMEDIARVAAAPRPIGSPTNQAARELLINALQEMGLRAETQEVPAWDYYAGSDEPVTVVNVVARIPGTASTGAVAVVGHYDTVPLSPGANDDASAVAILLEAARNILSSVPLRNDVILLFTDGEEPAPRFGSEAFVTLHPWAPDVAFVINLEAIGGGGPSMLINVSGSNGFATDAYEASVPDPVAFSYITATTRLIGGSNTDIAPFVARGIPGLELAYLHGSSIYHTPYDNPRAVSRDTLQQQGAATLAIARRVGSLDLGSPGGRDDRAFFTVAGGWLLGYPSSWNLPFVLAAGLLLTAGAWRRHAWRGTFVGLVTTIVILALAMAVALAAWSVIAPVRPTMGVAEAYLYLGLLLLVVIGIGLVVRRVARRLVAADADAAGIVLVWWLLGLLAVLAAPDLGYPLVLPLLLAALALLVPRENGGEWWAAVRASVVGAVALVLLIPPIDTFYQLAQPRPGNPDSELIPIVIIPAALIVLAAELIRAMWLSTTPEPEPGSLARDAGQRLPAAS